MTETKIISNPHGFNKGGEKDIAPACTSSKWQDNNFVCEPISVAMRGRSKRGKSNGNYKQRLEMNESGVANTITSVQKDSMVAEKCYRIRKLTPRECFRLMGVDDADIDKIQLYPFGFDIQYPSYSFKERLLGMSDEEKRILMQKGISNSQQYKLAGNSIVIDVLYHLFRKMFCETENEKQQMTLF